MMLHVSPRLLERRFDSVYTHIYVYIYICKYKYIYIYIMIYMYVKNDIPVLSIDCPFEKFEM